MIVGQAVSPADLSKLPPNHLYHCRLSLPGQTIERPFYYGDLDAGYQRLSHQVERFFAADASVAMAAKRSG